jgi:hypothetical protein
VQGSRLSQPGVIGPRKILDDPLAELSLLALRKRPRGPNSQSAMLRSGAKNNALTELRLLDEAWVRSSIATPPNFIEAKV